MFAVVTPTDEESVHSGVPKLLVGETFPGESIRKYLARKIGLIVKFVSRSTELA